MGKAANARAWAEYERIQNRKQDEYFDGEAIPLTDEELEQISSDAHWGKVDAYPAGRGVGGWK